jgi:hypothetical protein
MHTPHQIVGTASDITVNVTQNIKQKNKKGEYVDLSSLLTNNQHHDSKQKMIFQQGELILQPDKNYKKIFSIDTWTKISIITCIGSQCSCIEWNLISTVVCSLR